MAQFAVILEQHEFELIRSLIDATHKLRLRSESGHYKGALHDVTQVPAARALAEDLKAVLDASKAARPSHHE